MAARAQPQKRTAAKPRQTQPRRAIDVSLAVCDRFRAKRKIESVARPFLIHRPPPGVVPHNATGMAFDDASLLSASQWAAGGIGQFGIFNEGLEFLGYPYLSQLAQRPEYRRIVEVIATEMTRKWIRLTAKGDKDKTDRIDQIKGELDKFQVRRKFQEAAEQDGYFGRSHLYIDLGVSDNSDELRQSIGDGRDKLSKQKVGKGSLKGFKCIEAMWAYPGQTNYNDPLRDDWYKPDTWFVNTRQIHASRFLTFIGREVPDLLKPAYAFGGLSLTQMAKPCVDNFLKTRQAVSDIIRSFTVFVLKTVMDTQLKKGGEALDNRIDTFNSIRNNLGLFALDKELEDFANVSAPIGGLDKLQSQSQEQICSISGLPLVKYTGITPSGLNASSDGEIRCFYDLILASQENLFRVNLTTVIDFIQLSLFGEVDEDIGFEFEPLWSLDEKAKAEVDKLEAETAQIRIDSSVISPEEERKRIADEPETPYPGLDVEDLPDLKIDDLPAEEHMKMQSELQTKIAEARKPDPSQMQKGSGSVSKVSNKTV